MTEQSVGGERPPDPAVSAEAGHKAEAGHEAEAEAVRTEPFVGDPEAEVVDGLPVLAEVRTIEHPSPGTLPAVQAAAAAATGFVAGAATVALVKRRAARKQAVRNGRGGARRPADLLPIAATRSFLVDVHVIAKPGD
jgi:hypothetical protein